MCFAASCDKRSPGYFMCPAHWRLLPLEVRKVMKETFASYHEDQPKGGVAARLAAEALTANMYEARRIVAAIELGVPA